MLKVLGSCTKERTLHFNSALFSDLTNNMAPPCLLISEDAVILLDTFGKFPSDAVLSLVPVG